MCHSIAGGRGLGILFRRVVAAPCPVSSNIVPQEFLSVLLHFASTFDIFVVALTNKVYIKGDRIMTFHRSNSPLPNVYLDEDVRPPEGFESHYAPSRNLGPYRLICLLTYGYVPPRQRSQLTEVSTLPSFPSSTT